MRLLIIITSALVMASSVHAEDLVVLGRLKVIEKDLPHCGFLYVGGVTEYEVLQVISGTYPEKRIFVVHGCIEMPRSGQAGTPTSFVTGDVHKLALVRENLYGIGIFSDKHVPQRFETFFCKRVDRYSKDGDKSHNNSLWRTAVGGR